MRPNSSTVGVLLQSPHECKKVVTALYQYVSSARTSPREYSEQVAQLYEDVVSENIEGNVTISEEEVAMSALGLMGQAYRSFKHFDNPFTFMLAPVGMLAEYAHRRLYVSRLERNLQLSQRAVFANSVIHDIHAEG